MPEILIAGGAILVVLGIAGTVLPLLPGPPLVFGGLLLAAWGDGFERVGWPALILLGMLTVAAEALDWVAGAWGAQRVKASRVAIVGAALGTLVGIVFGLPGLVLGPFLGAVAGEWIVLRDWRRAGTVGFGTWLGLLLATAAKMAIVFAMVGLFTLAWVI
ncbi:MAG: DUF456 domain-containing protein [Thermoanaerobaculia bacterium]